MAIVTSQQIARLYDAYKSIDVVFNKSVNEATGLKAKNVFLKCLGYQWPCIIYSTSMISAKLIIGLKPTNFAAIKEANSYVSLRYAFKLPDRNDLLTFFIASKVVGSRPYNAQNPDVHFVSIEYNQRPPDDFIEILGQVLEANANAEKRKEERIFITPDSLRRLGLGSSETSIQIEGVPRKCIIRDLSFSGAKILVLGLARFLANKSVSLRFHPEDHGEPFDMQGTVTHHESVEGRKDIAVLGIHFSEEKVPMVYKMRVNAYLKKTKTVPPSEG